MVKLLLTGFNSLVDWKCPLEERSVTERVFRVLLMSDSLEPELSILYVQLVHIKNVRRQFL